MIDTDFVMIEIDGSYEEGGGQIVRTAVALSAISNIPVRIYNIRQNRPNPGLSHQHVNAIGALAQMCSAKTTGVAKGSTDITFVPSSIKGGEYHVDIGTAGSITLLLQCMLPASIFARMDGHISEAKDPAVDAANDVVIDGYSANSSPASVQIIVSGGTDVRWAPTIDYMKHVTLAALSKMGVQCNIEVMQRGYYPRGGGCVKLEVHPSKLHGFDYLRDDVAPAACVVSGISTSSRLPTHVPQRQSQSAMDILTDAGYISNVDVECNDFESTGSSITLWSGFMGSSALGARGLPAEEVGSLAAMGILDELKSKASVDCYLSDQLIPYMGLCRAGSFTVQELTGHTKTNIWVVEKFLDVRFDIEDVYGGLIRVTAHSR